MAKKVQIMDIKLKKWGNSLGFRFPPKVAESFGLDENSIIELTESRDTLVIRKRKIIPDLDSLLASIPSDFQYPEDIADFVEGEAQGEERL